MPKINLEVTAEQLPVFLAFLKTLPYVKVVEEVNPFADFSTINISTSNSDYQAGQADELNKELGDLFGEK
jgi:hypothetical protein